MIKNDPARECDAPDRQAHPLKRNRFWLRLLPLKQVRRTLSRRIR